MYRLSYVATNVSSRHFVNMFLVKFCQSEKYLISEYYSSQSGLRNITGLLEKLSN